MDCFGTRRRCRRPCYGIAIAFCLLPLLTVGCGSPNDLLARNTGATARCNDGTYTNNADPFIGCQLHGGVDDLYRDRIPEVREPRIVAPEGRWSGTWASDSASGRGGVFRFTVRSDGGADGSFQSGGVSGAVRGSVLVSENPARIPPPATELVLQISGGDASSSTQMYSAVFNQTAANQLVGKLTRVSVATGESASAFPDESVTIRAGR